MLDIQIEPTKLEGVTIITPKISRDFRGYFAETFRQDVFDELLAGSPFAQDNHAFSTEANIVRGFIFKVLLSLKRNRFASYAVEFLTSW